MIEGGLVVEATRDDCTIAVAFDKFIIGLDVENIGVVVFEVGAEIFDEEVEKFGILVVNKRAARGVESFMF